MANVLQYSYRCIDEDEIITELRFEHEDPPTACRRGSTHTIDLDSVAIDHEISQNKVTIDENSDLTGGNYKFMQKNIPGPTGAQPFVTEFTWPYNITVFDIQFTPTDKNFDDDIHMSVLSPVPPAPYDFLGYGGVAVLGLTAEAGATALTISSVDNTFAGYDITILSGPTGIPGMTSCHMGEVLSVNKNTNTIVCENATNVIFGPNSIIKQEVYITDHKGASIGPPHRYPIGDSVVGGSFVPANSKVLVKYYNNSNDENKKMHTIVEYRY